MDVPGHAFYTGEEGFTGQRPLYLLGLNPGGDGAETVHQQFLVPKIDQLEQGDDKVPDFGQGCPRSPVDGGSSVADAVAALDHLDHQRPQARSGRPSPSTPRSPQQPGDLVDQ